VVFWAGYFPIRRKVFWQNKIQATTPHMTIVLAVVLLQLLTLIVVVRCQSAVAAASPMYPALHPAQRAVRPPSRGSSTPSQDNTSTSPSLTLPAPRPSTEVSFHAPGTYWTERHLADDDATCPCVLAVGRVDVSVSATSISPSVMSLNLSLTPATCRQPHRTSRQPLSLFASRVSTVCVYK